MSGLFGSTTIKGTRITDFAKTSADVGSTIPFLYGRAPVTGNVIFAALPPKENRQVKRQGKGGVKQETFTYTTSYAIAFCRGPIQGYWWIKRNGKVVYSQDPAAPIEDKDYAAKWAAKVMMYKGTSSQMPSSMIEAIKGTGRVSAFRYLAYIAVPDEDVTDGGGAIPSYEAVPIATPPEAYLTSHPYAQDFTDTVDTSATLGVVELHDALWTGESHEKIEYSPELRGGYLGMALRVGNAPEKINYTPTLVGGSLKRQLITYDNWNEKINYSPTLVSGELRRQLVIYDMLKENVNYAPTLVGGELVDETVAAPYVDASANNYVNESGDKYTDRRLP